MFSEIPNNRRIVEGVEDSNRLPPSVFRSAYIGLNEGIQGNLEFAADTKIALSGSTQKNPVSEGLKLMRREMETPYVAWPQKTAHFVGSLGGMLLDPTNWALGWGAGAVVEKGIAKGAQVARGFFPEIVTNKIGSSVADLVGEDVAKNLPKFMPKTIGGVGKRLTKSFAEAAAVMAPSSFHENFDEEKGEFNIAGGVKQTLMNGSLGMSLSLLGMAGGAIYGKIKAGKAFEMPKMGDKSTANLKELDEALEKGNINQDMYDWAKLYLEKPNKVEKLHELGAKVLASEGYNVNHATNSVFMEIVDKQTLETLHASIYDQMLSDAPEDLVTALSDHMHLNNLDELKAKYGHTVDGLKGFISHLDNVLANAEKNMKLTSKIRRKEPLEHINSSHPMSQKNLYKRILSGEIDEKYPSANIPKVVRRRLSARKDIEGMNIPKEEKKQLMANAPKLMTPSKELDFLEKHFLTKDELPKNFQLSPEYGRLEDLAHFSEKAKALLKQVNRKNDYEIHRAYRDIINSLTKLLDSDIEKYANPDKMMSYLQNRLEETTPSRKSVSPEEAFRDKREYEDLNNLERHSAENEANSEELLKNNEQNVRNADSKELDEDYEQSKNQYKQFQKASNDLDTAKAISCIMGGA